jgi:signal transduction histidine kinase
MAEVWPKQHRVALEVEVSTSRIDRLLVANRLSVLRRAAAAAVVASLVATVLFVDPSSNLYTAITWIPLSALFAVTASNLLFSDDRMSSTERHFWRTVAVVGFFSSVTMLAFGLTGYVMGSLAALSVQGRAPGTAWIAGAVSSGVVVTGLVLYAVVLRARSFFPEPHHPRLAALDAISLGAAILAIQGILAIPAGDRLGWVGALALVQLIGWSIAVSGAFLNVLQGHSRFAKSAGWIFIGCLAHSTATSILMAEIMNAIEGRPAGGSAIAAFILGIGAVSFGEAFDADRRAASVDPGEGYRAGFLYPSLEADAFRMAALPHGRIGELSIVAGPLVSIAGPIVLAITLGLVLSGRLEATALHRSILYAAFAIALTASVGKLALGRISESQAAARISTMLLGEKALVDEILRAVDKDRSAVASLIHDGLVQPMTAAYLKLSHAKVMLERGDLAEATRLLKEGSSSISEQIAEARSLVTTVYPPSLEHLGLGAALKELVAAYGRYGLAVEAEWDWAGNVERQVAVAMYRVANEALENALLHANPKRAKLRLCSTQAGLELEVSDNGPGFVLQPELDYIEAGKLGIATMHRVADMIGAAIEIESEGRTVVRISIPLSQRARAGV